MLPDPTPEKLAGILQAEKERKERCERILKKYEKVKVVSEKKIQEEKFKKFKNG